MRRRISRFESWRRQVKQLCKKQKRANVEMCSLREHMYAREREKEKEREKEREGDVTQQVLFKIFST